MDSIQQKRSGIKSVLFDRKEVFVLRSLEGDFEIHKKKMKKIIDFWNLYRNNSILLYNET